MLRHIGVSIGLLGLALTASLFSGCDSAQSISTGLNGSGKVPVELLNVSYDPTRELWQDLNAQFIAQYKQETGRTVSINQSHGGSSAQARAVVEGLEADVATLALWSDTDEIRKHGLIKDGWEDRLPNRSLPYFSTIVFVVRKGNSKRIQDWPDLVKRDVEVVTPNPKTSGNGKLSFLAAWGSVVRRGGSADDARNFVAELYRHVPKLDTGARAATTTFSQNGTGDVHLTWENEAYFEVDEAKGELELVYPPISIRAEPRVAVVDANVDRKGTRDVAEAYLKFLYTPQGQTTIARHHYRPIDPAALGSSANLLPPIVLFSIEDIGAGWGEAESKFFAADGVFDQIYARPKK